MNNSNKIVLSKTNFIALMIGAMVGIGCLALPASLAKVAHQDCWISALVGGIYPVGFVTLSSYIIKKCPNDNILIVSKTYLGKILGSVFNFIFLTFLIYIGCNVIAGYSNLMRGYVVGWLTPLKFITICAFIVAYSAYKGIKTVSKVCEIAAIILFILAVSPLQALRFGSMINIKPILGSGIQPILSGIQDSLYSYSGIEIMLLFYPFVKDKKKVKWYSLVSSALVIILFTWICFISVYYLSPDIVTKSQWPFILATQSVTITIINNYSYFFILLWGIIGMRCVMIYYYSSMVIIKSFVPNIEKKWICLILYFVFVYVALKLGNEITRRSMVDKVIKIYTIINLITLSVLCIILLFKKDESK